MEEAGRCDDPNVIHRWNIFKSEVIEKPNYYKNHFRLMKGKRELLETICYYLRSKEFCRSEMSNDTNFIVFITGHKIS